MARARTRHVQQDFLTKHGDKVRDGRGGKRPGAGRKPKGKRASSPHKKRPTLKRRFPVHVVLRVVEEIGTLRKRHMFKAIREATVAVAMRELHVLEDGAFRIVHVSIQRDHIHLLVEADNKTALSRGMQSFQISAAKHLNRAVSVKRVERRRGTVFPDRFHQEIITTPNQARHALAYVLNNWRKHREDRALFAKSWMVDPFSTGIQFTGWKELEGSVVMWSKRETYQPLIVYLPKTWLLCEGWRLRGRISVMDVPSRKQLAVQLE